MPPKSSKRPATGSISNFFSRSSSAKAARGDSAGHDHSVTKQITAAKQNRGDSQQVSGTTLNAFSAMMKAAHRKPVPVRFELNANTGSEGGTSWSWQIEVVTPDHQAHSDAWHAFSTVPPRKGLQQKGVKLALGTNLPTAKGPPPGKFVPCMAPSLLKSILQKAVRRRQVPQAMKAAVQLWYHPSAGPEHLLRRLQVIAVEDSVVHAAAPALAWCMLAVAKGYILSSLHLQLLVSVAAQLAACSDYERHFPEAPMWTRPASAEGGLTGTTDATASASVAMRQLLDELLEPALAFDHITEGGGGGQAGGGSLSRPPPCTLPDLLYILLSSGGQQVHWGPRSSMCAGVSLACWLRASHGGMGGDVNMLYDAARRWAWQSVSPSVGSSAACADEDSAQQTPAGAAMLCGTAVEQASRLKGVVCAAMFKHGGQAFASKPSAAAWVETDAPKVMVGVDMHNEGTRLLPPGELSVQQLADGVPGMEKWAACAQGMLGIGLDGSSSFFRHATILLWALWSGTNVRAPTALSGSMSPERASIGQQLVQVYKLEALKRICANHFVS